MNILTHCLFCNNKLVKLKLNAMVFECQFCKDHIDESKYQIIFDHELKAMGLEFVVDNYAIYNDFVEGKTKIFSIFIDDCDLDFALIDWDMSSVEAVIQQLHLILSFL